MQKVKCISNENYLSSLTIGQEYVVVEDDKAQTHGCIRVIDNTEDSYLYPVSLFVVAA